MKLSIRKLAVAGLSASLLAVAIAGCGPVHVNKNTAADVSTILIGHHYQPEDDPYWIDEITGESEMSEDNRRAAIAALDTVKEKLGVDIKWVSYPSDIKQCVLQTVLAGDPICHIPIMANGSQGTLLSQNVLQKLDPYVDIFNSNPDYEWVLLDKCFGAYYLMNRDFLYMNNWPMVYNATYIEQVPSLKENGETLYPATLYERGDWTWSTFEDYLNKLKTYFRGKKADNGHEIYPFHTNYTYTLLFAFHSNGACLYDGNEMSFDSPEGIDAAMYLTRLMRNDLVNVLAAGPTTSTAGYMAPTDAFINGESVFNNIARWKMGQCASVMAERGESMGVIPFPRPDDIKMTDPYADYDDPAKRGRYQIYSSVADSVGLLKGFSEAESRLALEAYCMYRSEFYKHLADVDSVEEYINEAAVTKAVEDGVDIFHPVIGEANMRIYKQLGSIPENEFGESIEVFWDFAYSTFGNSVWGVGGAPDYSINVISRRSGPYNKIETISKALNSGEVVDDVTPSVGRVDGSNLVFAEKTNPKKINWLDYFTASDNVDGDYELKLEDGEIVLRGSADLELAEEEADKLGPDVEPEEVPFESGRFTVDDSAIDYNTVGEYTDALVVKVTDKAGNQKEAKYTVYIYDKENTVPPTLQLKEGDLKTVNLDAMTEEINWGNDYVEKAEDVNGIDIKNRVSADVSELDVTTEGDYPVTIYVEDFVGNRTEIPVTLQVKKPE